VYQRIQFGDDLILGDPTIGIPAIYFEEAECLHWHSSYWIPERADRDKVRRSFAFAALWSFTMAFLNESSLREHLPDCVRIAQARLDAFAKEDNSRQRMDYMLRGEQALIRDFSRAVESPEIEKAANMLTIAPGEDKTLDFPTLERVRKVIPQRVGEGFPYDLVKLPYGERRPLPNGMIYGAFATVVAKMDGKKSLCDIITEAVWEHRLTVSDNTNHFVPLSEKLIAEYIDAVYYLADGGYLTVREEA
jgi:hypothetical protein